jgi:hypothetical protein
MFFPFAAKSKMLSTRKKVFNLDLSPILPVIAKNRNTPGWVVRATGPATPGSLGSSPGDPRVVMLNKLRSGETLTKAEQTLYESMDPVDLASIGHAGGGSVPGSFYCLNYCSDDFIEVGDILKCDLHLKHTQIRGVNPNFALFNNSWHRLNPGSNDIFNTNLQSKKISFYLFCFERVTGFSFTNCIDFVRAQLWRQNLADLYSKNVVLEAVSVRRVEPVSRYSSLYTIGCVEYGSLPFSEEQISTRPFVFGTYSHLLAGTKTWAYRRSM